MSNLVLLPTLDRLAPYDDDATGERAFGLTLSVALSAGAPDSAVGRTFLQPWTWQTLPEEVLLIPIGADGAPERALDPTTATLRGPADAAGAVGAGHPAWVESLAERFTSLAGGGPVRGHWTWPIPDGWDTSERPDEVPWSAFVGEMALLPWPLAQSLNLSYSFRVRPKAVAAAWVAAPLLPTGWLGDGWRALRPVPCGVDRGQVRIEYFEEITPGGPTVPSDPPVVAFTRSVPHDEPKDVAFFDLGSLWVRHPGADDGGAVWRDDWRAALEDRLAEGLRVSALLAERIEAAIAAGTTDDDLRAALPLLARRAVALLADVHGPGVRRHAPGGRLAERLVDAGDDRPIPRRTVERVADGFYGNGFESFGERSEPSRARLDTWAARVATVTGNDSAKVLLERPAMLSLADVLARWRSLDATLSTRETAEALFRAHWRDLGNVELGELPFVDPRRQLRRDHLGLVWPAIQAALADLDGGAGGRLVEMRAAIEGAVDTFLRTKGRFDGLPGALGGRWLSERIRSLVAGVVPSPTATPTTRRLRGLTLQVDTVAPDPGEGVDLLERVQGVGVALRRLAVGDVPATPWLPLHVGRAVLPPAAIPAGADIDTDPRYCVADRVLLPSRLVYRDGLRDATLTYDNAPIGLEGPLARASGTGLDPGDAAADTLLDPSLRFVASPEQRIPALAYGAKYRAQPFLVTTNGATPKALLADAAGALPWGLASEIDRDRLAADAPPPREVTYLRRTPVGPLRPVAHGAEGKDARRRPFALPAIPDGVGLRSRELATAEAAKVVADPLAPQRGLFDDTMPSLLLVADDHRAGGVAPRATFQFEIRPPAIDLETWDRFLALDAARPGEIGDQARARRQRVWESIYEASIVDHGLSAESTPDRSLDDPAVDRLEARLWRLGPDGKSVVAVGEVIGGGAVPWLAKHLPVDQVSAPDRSALGIEPDLRREQRDALGVRVEITHDVGAEGVVPESGGLVVRVLEGQVYRLTLGARYDQRTVDRLDQEALAVNTGWTSPWHLAIEVAEPMVSATGVDPAAERHAFERLLWTRLEPRIAEAMNGRLEVALGGARGFGLLAADPVEARLARHALRAELRHQSWGWRGRAPFDEGVGHPAFGAGFARLIAERAGRTPEKHAEAERDLYLEWELANLGDRDDFEHRRASMHRRHVSNEAGEPIAAGAPIHFVFAETLESGGVRDLRASHHRFGVRVWSRYAPVLRPELGSAEARDVTVGDKQTTSRRPWRSLFIPCRVGGEIPVPKVRAVLPLTDHRPLGADDSDRQAPGWLVVLDEAWFEVGGLAETLEVEAAAIISPDVAWGGDGAMSPETCGPAESDEDTKLNCRYLQIGPDPIYTGDDVLDVLYGDDVPAHVYRALDDASFDVVFDRVHGPAGHHRDASDRSPRVLASSFVVRPPRVEGPRFSRAVPDPAFWMVQVRFRRRLVGHDTDGRRVEIGRSAPTAPVWIQLVPSLSRTDDDWFGAQVRAARVEGGQVLLEGAGYRPTDERKRSFSLYAVLTRRVIDVTGRADQEVYLGVSERITANRFALPAEAPTERQAHDAFEPLDVWLRLMEVQHHPTMSQPGFDRDGVGDGERERDTLWKRLFEPSVADHERARLVRMSEPIRLVYPSSGDESADTPAGVLVGALSNP